jgi:hypothetical protein
MPSSFEALAVLLVLLPGFLCARIVQTLFVRPQQTELDKFIEALLYSFIIYVCFALTFQTVKIDALNRVHLIVLTGYSVGLGLVTATSLTNDWVGNILRRFRVTQRTSNSSLWNDTFRTYGGYVLVELKDGRLVLGWVRYFADHEEQASLFLEDAYWIDRDGKRIQIEGYGILLTRDSGIKNLMFVKSEVQSHVATAKSANA